MLNKKLKDQNKMANIMKLAIGNQEVASVCFTNCTDSSKLGWGSTRFSRGTFQRKESWNPAWQVVSDRNNLIDFLFCHHCNKLCTEWNYVSNCKSGTMQGTSMQSFINLQPMVFEESYAQSKRSSWAFVKGVDKIMSANPIKFSRIYWNCMWLTDGNLDKFCNSAIVACAI